MDLSGVSASSVASLSLPATSESVKATVWANILAPFKGICRSYPSLASRKVVIISAAITVVSLYLLKYFFSGAKVCAKKEGTQDPNAQLLAQINKDEKCVDKIRSDLEWVRSLLYMQTARQRDQENPEDKKWSKLMEREMDVFSACSPEFPPPGDKEIIKIKNENSLIIKEIAHFCGQAFQEYGELPEAKAGIDLLRNAENELLPLTGSKIDDTVEQITAHQTKYLKVLQEVLPIIMRQVVEAALHKKGQLLKHPTS